MAIHLTPTELGREAGMHRREVISRCMEMGVPIFQGRIDKTLFLSSLKDGSAEAGARQGVAPGVRLDSRRMEAVTAGATGAQGTGSKTIADLLPLAVKKYGDKPAQRHKVGDEWVEASYNELGEVVKEVALGLVDLGIQPGDKVSILAHTRPEWTHACFGILTAGGTLVTIYQTNSPEECQYVLEHSDSRAIFVEDAEQLAKVREVEDSCPELEHVIVMEPGGRGAGRRAHARRAARARPRP